MILVKIPFATIIEWLCLFAAIILITNKPNPKQWIWFVPYLALTVGIETYSYVLVKTSTTPVDVQWIYNLFMLVYVPFHLYIFSKIINIPAIQKIIFVMLILFSGIFFWDWYNLGFWIFFSTANTIFGGCIILLSLLYYYTLMNNENPISFTKTPAFWFVTGCLVFYATTTGVNAFFKEIISFSKIYNFPIRFVIMNLLNIIMYSCWIKAFLCLRNTQSHSQPSY